MTFGSDHYVPVLKAKRGEKRALERLPRAVRDHVTPLLEVPELAGTEKTLREHLKTAFAGLADSVRGYSRCFLDTRELAPFEPCASERAYWRAAQAGIAFTPVLGLARSAAPEVLRRYAPTGAAVRVVPGDLRSGNLAARLMAFLGGYGLAPSDTDLIVDLACVDDMVPRGVADMAIDHLSQVPAQTEWRTLTLAACAFPRSMSCVDRNSSMMIDRAEWLAWRDLVRGARGQLERVPTFSDCAIQHPRGVEGFNPRLHRMSAGVRYALQDSWLLLKGVDTKTERPVLQFARLATQLVNGSQSMHFAGAPHCAGCADMAAAANGAGGLGSAEKWRELGTIHHITTTAEALASLHDL